jgi:hypothetical protein
MKKTIIASLLLAQSAFALIPPINEVIARIFEGRPAGRVSETVLKHHITMKDGQNEEWEERLITSKGKYFYIFRNGASSVAGAQEARQNVVGNKKFPAESLLFLKYIGGGSSDEFRDQLLSEGFIKRDHLQQFKTGYEPKGDPRTWPVTDFYIKHAGIFLAPPNGAITVVGSEDGARRKSVGFDPSALGVDNWQESDNGHIKKWSFQSFSNVKNEGFFPKIFNFENDNGRVTTEWVTRRSLSPKQIADFQANWRTASQNSLSSDAELSLGLLLSYR